MPVRVLDRMSSDFLVCRKPIFGRANEVVAYEVKGYRDQSQVRDGIPLVGGVR